MKKLLSLVLALVMLFTAGAAFAEASPTVYKVEAENGNTIYLFGTIHAMNLDVYDKAEPFGAALEEAYAYADTLAVELDLFAALSDPELQAASMAEMLYTDGTTVLDHGLTEEMLNEVAAMIGAPAEMLSSIKLSNWPALLLVPVTAELNMDIQGGVDLWLLQRAYNDEKPVVELENMDEQQAALTGISDELVVQQIKDLLEDPTESVNLLADMYDAWRTGDAEGLKKLLDASEYAEELDEELAEDLESFNEGLSGERDDAFLEDAIAYLESGEKVLIAIGAAHIIGETGIASRLVEAGYTVTDISR